MVQFMDSPLSETERELLSAYVDDEVTDDERRQVEKLLEQEDAAEYLFELRAVRELAIEHGSVRAPVGLHARVMERLEGKIKPGASQALPVFNWRMPLYAAAAVLLAALGIMFGPSLFSPGSTDTPPVARGDLEEFGTDASGDRPVAERESESVEAPGEVQDSQFGLGENATAELAKARAEADEPNNEEARNGGGSEPPEPDAEGLDSNRTVRADDSEAGLGGGVESRRDRAARKVESEGARDADGTVSRRGGDDAGAAPADAPEPDESGGRSVEISVNAGDLTAQNDVIWVSSLHGDVTLAEDDNGAEYLKVEVGEGRVEGLRRALDKLAREQGYGAESLEAADGEDAPDTTIRGYLPVEAEADKLRDEADVRTVSVIIHLK